MSHCLHDKTDTSFGSALPLQAYYLPVVVIFAVRQTRGIVRPISRSRGNNKKNLPTLFRGRIVRPPILDSGRIRRLLKNMSYIHCVASACGDTPARLTWRSRPQTEACNQSAVSLVKHTFGIKLVPLRNSGMCTADTFGRTEKKGHGYLLNFYLLKVFQMPMFDTCVVILARYS